MKTKIINILISPFAIAIIVTVLIIVLLPAIPKYEVELVEQMTYPKTKVYFDDLNSDGYSEKIESLPNTVGSATLKLYNHKGGFLGQINFSRPYTNSPSKIYFGDYDMDGFKEIYFFSISLDSVFVSYIEPLGPGKYKQHDKFVDVIRYTEDELLDFSVSSNDCLIRDLDGDGFQEMVIMIKAGYSLLPRKLYVYDIYTNTLISTPSFGSINITTRLFDINHDGNLEILGGHRTYGNIPADIDVPFKDSSSWLMVFNKDLEFLFDPVEFDLYTNRIRVFPFPVNDTNYISLLYLPKDTGRNVPRLQLYTPDGEFIRERVFEYEDRNLLKEIFTTDPETFSNLFFLYYDGTIAKVNSDLKTDGKIKDLKTNCNPVKIFDIDNDGTDEIILFDKLRQGIFIVRDDFSHPVTINLGSYIKKPHITLKLNGNKPSQLSIQLNDIWSLYDYRRNPYFKLRFLFWLGIYLGVLLFVLLIRKFQLVQIEKRAKIQQQLSELQLKSIKNQIDPHFTFNTINAINSLIYKEDRDTAYHLTSKFSNLIRSSLENSDKIQTTLKEEIDFITNWLDLQKFRFQNKFDYEIDIAESINLQMEIPRNILQTYVENAIKHGLKHRGKDGFLKINILHINKHLQISITDNGIGRKAAREKSRFSTGKGLDIMEQIFKLYEKLYNISITQEITDLYDDNGNPTGTKVLIKLPLRP